MDWLEIVLPIIKDLAIIFVVVVVVPGVQAAIKWWRNVVMEEWVRELVEDAVLFVQEKYWDHAGEDKFNYAKYWVIDRLNEKGVNVSIEWLDGLIDAAVKRFREELAETWYREQ